MSTPTPEQIRDEQRQVWNKFSPGWKKWDEFMMSFMQPMGDEIVAGLRLAGRDQVLDIATGTGEPGLTIAALHPAATVIGTDLAEDMLAIAAERARALGRGNYRTQVADVCALSFPPDQFDAVSCRFGFMFFPDMPLAAREVARVLKPGGRFVTIVWGPREKNSWITTMMHPIMHHAALPPPVPDAPGMFRCGAPGRLAGLLREAGFRDVAEKEVSGQVWFDGPDHYWSVMTEVAAPVATALGQVDEKTRATIKDEVFAAFRQAGGKVELNYSARSVSGTK